MNPSVTDYITDEPFIYSTMISQMFNLIKLLKKSHKICGKLEISACHFRIFSIRTRDYTSISSKNSLKMRRSEADSAAYEPAFRKQFRDSQIALAPYHERAGR